ncbi:MAG: hypothetical protein GEEBNDBF_01974 [bacterium]|nr:hypothetical protein [bacterium]
MPRTNLLAFAHARGCDPLVLLKELRNNGQLTGDYEFPEEYIPTLEQRLDLLPGVIVSAPAAPDPPLATIGGMNELELYVRASVRKLKSKGKVGASHTSYKSFLRGAPDHLKGGMHEALQQLMQSGVVEGKHTKSRDIHIRLNPHRMDVIDALLDGKIEDPELRRRLQLEP